MLLYMKVDALRPGLLGKDRAAFSYRYCGRRLIPVGRHGSNTKKYDNTGLSRAGELHALLKEVSRASWWSVHHIAVKVSPLHLELNGA